MSSHTNLSAAVDDRKARLAKLKTLKRKQPDDEPSDSAPTPARPASPSSAPAKNTPEPDVARLHLSGRNYDVETKGPKLGFEAPPTQSLEGPTLEESAAAVEDEVRKKAREDAMDVDQGIDLFKLQPKKPNWDLKRDLDKKLELLNVRTDNAIAKLVRERIEGAKKSEAQAAAPGGDGEAVGLDGVALVEGLRIREREVGEEERREREDDMLG